MTTGFISRLNLTGDKSEPQLFSGIAYPFGPTVLSVFAPKDDESILRTSIENILMTRFGERVMRPSFGSNVHDLLFEPSDEVLAVALRAAVQQALQTWEPRALIGRSEIELGEQIVTIRVPLLLQRPGGPRDINATIELDRETLYNLPGTRSI